MGIINVYNTLSNEKKVINQNGRLQDILPNYDFSKSIILNEGYKLDPNYEVKPEDIIYIRAVPYGMTTAIVIAAVVAVVAAGVSIGMAIRANEQAQEAKEKAEKAQKDANNLAQQTTQLPFIKGAKNKKALGYALQYVMGNVYNTPYLLTDGYYSIGGENGNKQYWNAILCCGYGPQIIKDISIGNVKIKDFGEDVEINEGVYSFDSGSIYSDSNNKIEIRQNTDFTLSEFSKKVISVNDGSEIKHDFGKDSEPVIKQLATNTKKVQVCIQFNSLRKYDTNSSNWDKCSVKIIPYWSNDNGATWNAFNFDGVTDNTFNFNVNHTIRFTATKEFTYLEAFDKDILIKLDRVTPHRESNTNEDAYLLYYNSFCYDAQKSQEQNILVDCKPLENWYKEKTTRIGIKIIANSSTQDTLDEINITSLGVARVYDGSNWTTTKQATRNPSSWILELLTSSVHPHSQYSDSEIDLDSFAELYNYCEENEFYTDGIITQATKKREIIEKILQTVFADLILDSNGRLSIVIDRKETTPVALINGENVRSIKVAKSFERSPDGIKINYTNRNGWKTDTIYTMLDGEERTNDDILTETTIDFTTESKHIHKIGQRKIRMQKLQPREIIADVGKEGDYYPLYSTIMLQMKELKIGVRETSICNVLKSGNTIIGFEVSDKITFDSAKEYGAIIQAQNDTGLKHYYLKCNGVGSTNTVYLIKPLEITSDVMPQARNIVSIGELDENGEFSKVKSIMKIAGISPNGDNGYSLTLKDYNDAIYEYGTIPEYKTNLTSVQKNNNSLTDVRFSEMAEGMKQDIEAKILKLFNTTQISVYKESNHPLTREELPTSNLTYDFTTGVASWTNCDAGYPLMSNGWSLEYPTNPANTVYITTATAQNQSTIATIEPGEWATPIPSGLNGSNGMNTYTITLYTRENNAPTYKPSTLTYNFISGSLTGIKNGWAQSIPTVDENKPVWEIHATALSDTSLDTIEPSEWSEPTQITSDGLSYEQVKEIIKEETNNLIETPNVYVDYNAASFAVNSKRLTCKAQEVTITAHVVQLNKELDFLFDTERLDAILPRGWGYSINRHSITIRVNSGVKITSGDFVIPIIFRAYKYDNVLAYTLDGVEYVLGYGDYQLGYNSYYEDSTVYDIGFTYTGVIGGLYLGKISNVADIPSDYDNLTIGDYFTYTGDNVASVLAQEGQFRQCAIYYYSGDANNWRWEKDNDSEHLVGALSDVLSVANADLNNNNSDAKEYLDHLTANSAFINDLVVGNTAFIQRLIANELIANKIQTTELNAAMITSGKISADRIDATALFTQDIILKGAFYTDNYNYDTKTGFKISGEETIYNNNTFELNSDNIRISKNGDIEMKGNSVIGGNVLIGENTTITGNVISGPMILSNEKPSALVKTYDKGTFLSSVTFFNKCEGTYGTISFYRGVKTYKKYSATYDTYDAEIILYDNSGKQVYYKKWHDKYPEDIKLDFDLIQKRIVPDSTKTLKFIDLPNEEPADKGIVYTDKNGFLKIKL